MRIKMSVNATEEIGGNVATTTFVAIPEDYLALIRQFPLWPIETAGNYRRGLALANKLLEKKAGGCRLARGEAGYLAVLVELLENYEKKRFPRRRVTDGEMLAHLIDAKGVTQTQVERDTAIAAPTISAVIADRRRLTRSQIGKLAAYFGVMPTVFSFDA
jgi:HTH-type transcriptional regulator/antitoxin HigA